MARQLEFEPNEALEQAMLAFWRHGYAGTSVADLEDSTGVGRKSLYRVFQDKHDLFLKVLALYRRVVGDQNLGPLERSDADLSDIADMLRGFAGSCGTEQARMGCLIANTALERAAYDQPAGQQVHLYFDRMRAAFRNALGGARRQGQVAPTTDSDACANYLVGVVQGVCVMARSDSPADMVNDFVETALATLR